VEQDLRIDPITGLRMSDPANKDAKQNLNYVRHTDLAETARDFSKPHTIPADEYEAATGLNHADALAAYRHNEDERKRNEAMRNKRLAGELREQADALER
jgi:hypothetical protein